MRNGRESEREKGVIGKKKSYFSVMSPTTKKRAMVEENARHVKKSPLLLSLGPTQDRETAPKVEMVVKDAFLVSEKRGLGILRF